MVADLDLRVALGRERREPGCRRRRRERCACVEVVLEVMRSSGGAVALDDEQEMMEGKERRHYIGGPLVPGEATARD